MKTEYYTKATLAEAAALLKAGEVVAFPTETVYGLGADATNGAAVKKVYEAKNRPADNPLIIHVTSLAEVRPFVTSISAQAEILVEHFWPGPLTLIFDLKEGVLPAELTGGLKTGSFRMPNNTLTLELIRTAGCPLVGPSANTSGKPSPTTAAHVYHDLKGRIAGIVDDGPTSVGLESTVLDLTSEVPTILRPGAVTQAQLSAVIGPVALDGHFINAQEQPKSPGMKYKHYAPEKPIQMIDWEKNNWHEALEWAASQGLKVALLASEEILATLVSAPARVLSYRLSVDADVRAASQQLFAGLRFMDEATTAYDFIFVQT